MLYLALGGAALAVYLWITGGRPLVKRREWRLPVAAAALAAFTGAAFAGVRGGWGLAIVMGVVGLWLAASARNVSTQPPPLRMSEHEARQILGVEEGASRGEIQAAYSRLMRRAHPDVGGTQGLAAQLNAARDRLLRG
jgi:hypothetical protein